MGTDEIMESALQLKPQDRLVLVDLLLESVDRPDQVIDETWMNEAQRRLDAYRAGRIQGIPLEDIFDDA